MNDIVKYNYTILFVEDEKKIRENYTSYLKRFFLDVFEACDGEEAYKLYKSKKPNIIIADINMPKMNGLELVSKIREDDHNTRVIMLTAYSEVSYLLEAVELKLSKYLVKPISRNELKEALDVAIDDLKKFFVESKDILDLQNDFCWDYTKKDLFKGDDIVKLTIKEKEILDLLIQAKNRVLTYEDIIRVIWDDEQENKLNALKTLIKTLRKKLPENLIKNIYGEGFKLEI